MGNTMPFELSEQMIQDSRVVVVDDDDLVTSSLSSFDIDTPQTILEKSY